MSIGKASWQALVFLALLTVSCAFPYVFARPPQEWRRNHSHRNESASMAESRPRAVSRNPASIGWRNLPANFTAPISSMSVRGHVPAWLNCSLYRNGPVWWDDHYLNHWFFGLAMLHVFHIKASRISYTNQYLRTSVYEHYLHSDEATKEPIFDGKNSAIQSQNTQVTIRKVDNHLLANGGSTASNEFSPIDVSTVQAPFNFGDQFQNEVGRAPSHGHTDIDGRVVHFFYNEQPGSLGYQFYQIAPHSTKRELLGDLIPISPLAKSNSYMHSFALSKNYAILSDVPGFVDGPEGFASPEFVPELGTRWIIVDRATGVIRSILKSPAFFMYHHINAYEDVNEAGQAEIVVDVVTYPDMATLPAMFVKNLINDSPLLIEAFCKGGPHRYRLPLHATSNTTEIVGERLWEGAMEFPTIHYEKLNTKKYRFFYGVSATKDLSVFMDKLVKVDLETPNPHGEGAASLSWDGRERAYYPGEPIFVPRDFGSNIEDDGVVLSLVLSGLEEHSFLLVLDARTFQELATAPLTFAVPFGFHGRHFFNATALAL